jgi:glucose-1-phosphate thymidylyltransferase
VLDEIKPSNEGHCEDSKLEGRVVLEEGAVIRRSLIRGPVVIGRDAVIEDSYIGPYTSLGDRVEVRRSEIEHSIVLADSVVEDLPSRLEASLLGRRVRVTKSDGPARTLKMLVGDRSEIEII